MQVLFRAATVRERWIVENRSLTAAAPIFYQDTICLNADSEPMNDADIEILLEEAKAQANSAYCPYSRFRVGAAVLGRDSLIYSGCNIENASYGLTICAERVALFNMLYRSPCREAAGVVIFTPTTEPVPPCGACRQVLAEFAGPDMPILSFCDGEGVLKTTIGLLLPECFKLEEFR